MVKTALGGRDLQEKYFNSCVHFKNFQDFSRTFSSLSFIPGLFKAY